MAFHPSVQGFDAPLVNIRRLAVLVAALAAASPSLDAAFAQARNEQGLHRPVHGRKAAPQRAPAVSPPVTRPAALPDPPIPVRQANEIGLGACAPILDLMSRQTLTTTYDVQSGWSRADPSHHIFQSVAALNNAANTPPDGIAALIAAPVTAGGCDGVMVQVFPLAGDCQSAQKVMLKGGRLQAPLLNSRIMLDAKGNRVILLPAFAHTCIAISVETRFGTP